MNDTSGHPFAGDAIVLSGVNLSLGGAAARVHILKDIGLNIGRGEAVALLGPSGSGKSTLLMVMTGLERSDSGSVVVAGKTLHELDEDELARFRGRNIGIVFQAFHLIPTMTALENVAVPLELAGAGDAFSRAEHELAAVGLSGRLNHHPAELSGGEQQRVALARALARRPQALLLDEPFSSLDASLRSHVREEVHALLRAQGVTTVLVTHDQEEALSLADTVAVLREGRIIQRGEPAELYEQPADERLARFLGAVNVLDARFERGTALTTLGTLQLHDDQAAGEAAGVVMVRPEQLDVRVCDNGGRDERPAGLEGRVEECRYYGHDALLQIRPEQAGDGELLLARVHGEQALAVGTRVTVAAHGRATRLR